MSYSLIQRMKSETEDQSKGRRKGGKNKTESKERKKERKKRGKDGRKRRVRYKEVAELDLNSGNLHPD